jgi:hypothetical protein
LSQAAQPAGELDADQRTTLGKRPVLVWPRGSSTDPQNKPVAEGKIGFRPQDVAEHDGPVAQGQALRTPEASAGSKTV